MIFVRRLDSFEATGGYIAALELSFDLDIGLNEWHGIPLRRPPVIPDKAGKDRQQNGRRDGFVGRKWSGG